MSMEKVMLITWLIVGIFAFIASIGKDRQPITKQVASIGVFIQLILIALVYRA